MADYYNKGIALNHEEKLVKLNEVTGEFTEIKKRSNNIPSNKRIDFNKGIQFSKYYVNAMKYLTNVLTPIELKVVIMMINESKYITNSLEPMSNDSTSIEIANTFKIHRNSVKKIFDRLKYFGVYGVLEISNQGIPTNVWLLNPYISFKGKAVSTELIHLFDNTFIASAVKLSCKD